MTRDAEHTPSHPSVVVPDPLWTMHVIGPDDIYPAPDHATAVQWCAYLNSEIAPKVPSVLCVAVPAIWTGMAEEHAEGLAEAIKGWTLPAAPSSLAGGEVDARLHGAIGKLKAWVDLIQHGKRGEPVSGNPIVDCVNDLPAIVRELEAAELEIEGAFERYEDAALSPEAPAREASNDNPLTFGMGELVVNTGKFGGDNAVFIARAKEPGEVGAYTGKSAFDRKTLQPGELVMIFPTAEQVQVVADALVGALTPRHEAPAEGAGEREEVARLRTIATPPGRGLYDVYGLSASRHIADLQALLSDYDVLRARSSAPEARS